MPAFARFFRMKAVLQRGLCSALLGVSMGQALLAQPVDIQPMTADVVPRGAGTAPTLIVFTVFPNVQDAIPPQDGSPDPSIILGRIAAGQEAAFGIETLMPETIGKHGFAFDDLDAREAMRANDPEMLKLLVSQGHIDPPQDKLPVALQQELHRMNCYRSGVDGLWGGGSQRAAESYFKTRGIAANGLGPAPSAELFRAIVLGGDVRCVVTVRKAAPQEATNRQPQTRNTTTKPTTAKPAPITSSPTSSGKSGPSLSAGGSGIFR